MVGSGRLIGLVLIGIGAVLLFGAGIWAFTAEGMESGGRTLTLAACLPVAVLIAGIGVWFLMQGRTEATQFAEVEKQKKMLNMVQTQGTIQLSTMALELNMPMDQVKNGIYDLVGKGLFTGYVDWKAGKLVSSDAAEINQAAITGKCANCGAPQVVAGKGVVRCEYCGAEYFLPKS